MQKYSRNVPVFIKNYGKIVSIVGVVTMNVIVLLIQPKQPLNLTNYIFSTIVVAFYAVRDEFAVAASPAHRWRRCWCRVDVRALHVSQSDDVDDVRDV